MASVYLLHVNGKDKADVAGPDIFGHWWVWLIIALAIAAVAIVLWRRWNSRATGRLVSGNQVSRTVGQRPTGPVPMSPELMRQICDLMESQKLYLNSELKLNDVADAMNTNRNLISNCINSQRGCSFSQFVSTYRVEHAKDLIRRQPDIKISEVWMQSGFSTEGSFFRTFKAFTGMTPSEFKQKTTNE